MDEEISKILGLFKRKHEIEYKEYEECRFFYLSCGDTGYGEEVFKKDSGQITVIISREPMIQLVEQALKEGRGRLETETFIEDKIGSPGYPDYFWYETNSKQYNGKAVINMWREPGSQILDYSFELPEHEKYPWSGYR